MIEVLTSNTPNGKKITIMLEEIGYDYKITKINNLLTIEYFSDYKLKEFSDFKSDFKIFYLQVITGI